MQKKKILYIITKGNWGGAQRYVFDVATHLPKDQFEAVVAMGEGALLEQKLAAEGIRTVRLHALRETRKACPQSTDAGLFLELVRLFKQERPDIVHLNSSRASLFGSLAARFVSVSSSFIHALNAKRSTLNASRIIFTAHGWPFKEPRPWFVRLLIWLASYTTVLLSHEIITLSDGDYVLGRAMPGMSKKISLIYNGIEESRTLSREEARKKLFGGYDNVLRLGTVAELTRNKSIGTLIEALALLPRHVHLCIIGDGEDRKRLETLAIAQGVSERIVFTGSLEDAAAYLLAFDIFVLPSLKEGLPYSMLEAGVRGIPVVGSDISGIRDIVRDASQGTLVPARDARALGAALQDLVDHEEKRTKLGSALKERVTREFSFPQMLEKTLGLYGYTDIRFKSRATGARR